MVLRALATNEMTMTERILDANIQHRVQTSTWERYVLKDVRIYDVPLRGDSNLHQEKNDRARPRKAHIQDRPTERKGTDQTRDEEHQD